jgi:hypothetical protein
VNLDVCSPFELRLFTFLIAQYIDAARGMYSYGFQSTVLGHVDALRGFGGCMALSKPFK